MQADYIKSADENFMKTLYEAHGSDMFNLEHVLIGTFSTTFLNCFSFLMYP